MTKRSLTKQSSEHTLTRLQQGFTLEKQQEQTVYLEQFYNRLMGITFSESPDAIEHCRDLCAEYGFTVKQEASTHRNIYVYCSREGLPDSQRNPKLNPQRKRPSKRCDCRWRVVLFENEGLWEFRKSLNPEAGKHNHELMHPDEIERSWPKEVTDLIFELARLRMTTQEIRSRVKSHFPNVNWNERRFYNRLSEERQKIKQRDTTDRTHELCQLWSKICALSAGNEELSQFIKNELNTLYQTLSETTQVDTSALPTPTLYSEDDQEEAGFDESTSFTTSRRYSKNSVSNNAHKGFMSVDIPKQTYYIKVHNQRLIQEAQLIKSQRRIRNLSDEAHMYMLQPPRKLSRKGKDRENSMVSTDETLFQLNTNYSARTNSTPGTPTHGQSTPILSTPSTQRTYSRQDQPIHTSPFVYTYDNSISLESPLPGYMHSHFSTSYPMNTPNSSSFNTTDMQFQFDPSQQPIVRTGHDSHINDSSTSAIHQPLHKNETLAQSITLQHNQSFQRQSKTDIQRGSHQLYSINHSPVPNKPPQIQRPLSHMRMYEQPPENMVSNTRTLSPIEAQNQATYHPTTMYMRQGPVPAHHRNPNAVIPMYSQSSSSNDGSKLNIHQNHSQ